jgi:hypothetical protein
MAMAPSMQQVPRRRNNQHRQQWRRHHATDHRRGNPGHDFRAGTVAPNPAATPTQEIMQDGMGMMGRMRGGKGEMGMGDGMSMRPEMMGKRMDMMEVMMQMMMDGEAMKPPAPK